MQEFDIIVVGAGHAGCEAALASARMGMKTAIFTISLDTIGVMSCNPSLGGPAKSHLAREIDALGGEMGRNIDKTFIQIRVLNTRKGPAVRSLRAQADKMAYANEMKKTLEHTDNLSVIQGMVSELVVEEENGKKVIKGIKIREGLEYRAKAVIIATGTFLRGLIHIGEVNFSAGRMGELSSEDLPLSLEKIGLKLGRFKTGTPTRIDGRTIDYSVLEEQPGDKSQVLKFSNRTKDEDAFEKLYERIEKYEGISDNMEVEIAKYLDQVSDAHLSDDTKEKVRDMLREITEIESIGDSCFNIARTISRLRSSKEEFTESQYDNIKHMFELTDDALSQMSVVLIKHKREVDVNRTFAIESDINNYRALLRTQNINDINEHKYSYTAGTLYMDIIQECEKLGDYIVNVVEARMCIRK